MGPDSSMDAVGETAENSGTDCRGRLAAVASRVPAGCASAPGGPGILVRHADLHDLPRLPHHLIARQRRPLPGPETCDARQAQRTQPRQAASSLSPQRSPKPSDRILVRHCKLRPDTSFKRGGSARDANAATGMLIEFDTRLQVPRVRNASTPHVDEGRCRFVACVSACRRSVRPSCQCGAERRCAGPYPGRCGCISRRTA